LTTNTPPDSLSPKRRWPVFVIVALIIALIAVILVKGYIPLDFEKHDEEKTMPAIKVIISNGCGYEQLAATYADHIKDKNIDVIRLTDTPKPIYNKSLIVVTGGDEQDLKRLQKMTGIMRFTLAVSDNPEAPFNIILGQDYEDFMKK